MAKKRKRGAPPGNHNALKHGFYSGQFRQIERRAISQAANADLTGEINLLRVQILRYLEAENSVSGTLDYETRLSALRTVSLAAGSLIRLVRLQAILNLQAEEWKQFEERLNAFPLDEEDGTDAENPLDTQI